MWIDNLIYVENVGNIINNKKYWYEKIIHTHLKHEYVIGSNFCLDESFREFSDVLLKKLHQTSEEKYSKVIGKYLINEKNKNICWANVNNYYHYKSVIHDHVQTSVINSVFYFNVPDTNTAGITFYRNFNEKYLTYYPKNNDLIIFPNYLLHIPEKSLTEEYRISINMEIMCDFL
jgi:hypothetical protein